MSTLRETITAELSGDATLSALLPGGIFDSGELPRDGLTLDNAPLDGNNILQPCAVVRLRAANPVTPAPHSAERRYGEVYVYHINDYTVIDDAVRRVKNLLHRKYYGDTDNEGLAFLTWAGDLGEMYDEGLFAKFDRPRFQIKLTRS